MCAHNNNIPINIPSHPYVLLNRSILYNCDLEAESNFLSESLAACQNLETKADLTMYFTVNLPFVNYFESATENLNSSISTNWTTQEQILPVSIENFESNPKLLSTPKTLNDFLTHYKYSKEISEKKEQKEIEEAKMSSKFGSFHDTFMVDMLLFTAALITKVITLVVMYMVCRQSKIKSFSSKYSTTMYKSSRSSRFSSKVMYM